MEQKLSHQVAYTKGMVSLILATSLTLTLQAKP